MPNNGNDPRTTTNSLCRHFGSLCCNFSNYPRIGGSPRRNRICPRIVSGESDYHIHLEDDCKFITDIFIDPIIEVMKNNSNIVEIIFRRDTSKKKGGDYKVDGLPLLEMNLMVFA